MVLRLDPRIPIVWRDPQTVQIGVDPMLAVIPDVTPGLERLLAVVQAGVSESGFAMFASSFGVTPRQSARLRDGLGPALERPDDDAPRRRVLVVGAGLFATDLARILHAERLLAAAEENADLVVIVADHVVAPAEHRRWLQRDITHLPVTIGEAAVTIGPLVVPGDSACLHCVALHRRDRDPAWPAIATQLATTAAPQPAPVRAATALALLARQVSNLARGVHQRDDRELRVAGDGDEITEQRFSPHPECRCAAPQESDWAPADETADLPRPNAGRVCAVPA